MRTRQMRLPTASMVDREGIDPDPDDAEAALADADDRVRHAFAAVLEEHRRG